MSTVPNFLNFTVNAVLRPTFIQKLCYKLPSIVTFTFIQISDQNFVFFTERRQRRRICLLHRQNSSYFWCPVWKMKSWLNKKAALSQRWPCDARYISGSNEPLQRYGYSKLCKMATCRQLGIDVSGNSTIRSADPENPTRTKHEVNRITRYGDMAIRVS